MPLNYCSTIPIIHRFPPWLLDLQNLRFALLGTRLIPIEHLQKSFDHRLPICFLHPYPSPRGLPARLNHPPPFYHRCLNRLSSADHGPNCPPCHRHCLAPT